MAKRCGTEGSYYIQNVAESGRVYIVSDDGNTNTFHRFDCETMQMEFRWNSAKVPFPVGCLAVADDTSTSSEASIPI